MFRSSSAQRSGVAGIAGGAALCAAVLTGVATAPATAAPVAANYTCTVPGAGAGSGPQTFVASVDLVLPAVKAGQPVAAGAVSFNAKVTVPAVAAPAFATATSMKSDDFAIPFGSASIAAPLGALAKLAADGQGAVPFSGKGANKAVVLPASGTYAMTMPKAFTLVVSDVGGTSTIPCVTTTPASLGSLVLAPQTTRTQATARKSVAFGKRAKVKVSVTNEFGSTGAPGSGQVVAKEGSKVLASGSLVNGALTLKLKKLPTGKHKVTVSFAGNTFVAASTAKIKLVVAARR